MTFRTTLISAILSVLGCVPLAIEALFFSTAWWGLFAGAVAIAVPIIVGRVVPAAQAQMWARKHGLDLSKDEMKILAHLAAHSGLPYTNADSVLDAIRADGFYVCRPKVAMMRYLDAPVFQDETLRILGRKSEGAVPAADFQAVLDSGVTAKRILSRYESSGAPVSAVLDSFADGLPDEYFYALDAR